MAGVCDRQQPSTGDNPGVKLELRPCSRMKLYVERPPLFVHIVNALHCIVMSGGKRGVPEPPTVPMATLEGRLTNCWRGEEMLIRPVLVAHVF